MLSIKHAKKVRQRNWPYKKFSTAVALRAKQIGVKLDGNKTKIKTCYENGVTVKDTLRVIDGAA